MITREFQEVHTGSQEIVEGLGCIMTWLPHNTDSTGIRTAQPSQLSPDWSMAIFRHPGCRFLDLVSLELSNHHCSLSKDAMLFFSKLRNVWGMIEVLLTITARARVRVNQSLGYNF